MTGEKRSIALRLPGIMYHENVIIKSLLIPKNGYRIEREWGILYVKYIPFCVIGKESNRVGNKNENRCFLPGRRRRTSKEGVI